MPLRWDLVLAPVVGGSLILKVKDQVRGFKYESENSTNEVVRNLLDARRWSFAIRRQQLLKIP